MTGVGPRLLTPYIAALSTFVIGLAGPAHANHVREMSLEEKVRDSDIVMIARVETTLEKCTRNASCATVHVLTQLKGELPPSMKVLYNGDIAEDNPSCCNVGETYLFFLKGVGENLYRSVNGPYGIYAIQSAANRDLARQEMSATRSGPSGSYGGRQIQ